MVPTFWFANVRLPGFSETTGAMPVPESVMVWGDPAALSGIVMEALRLPAAVGVNVTEKLQLPPAGRPVPQALVCAKSPGLAPVRAMLPMVKVPVPVLLSVTD